VHRVTQCAMHCGIEKRARLFLRAVGWEGSERAVCMLKIAPVERRRLIGKRIEIPFSL